MLVKVKFVIHVKTDFIYSQVRLNALLVIHLVKLVLVLKITNVVPAKVVRV